MVTDEKNNNTALMRYRLGNVLIWLGILVWSPYIVLRIIGEPLAVNLYLPLHLIGVMGGSRLRTFARKELGMVATPKSRLRIFGHGLMFVAILVWVPYFYLKAIGQFVNVMDYLPYHLVGIIGGMALLAIDYWVSRKDV